MTKPQYTGSYIGMMSGVNISVRFLITNGMKDVALNLIEHVKTLNGYDPTQNKIISEMLANPEWTVTGLPKAIEDAIANGKYKRISTKTIEKILKKTKETPKKRGRGRPKGAKNKTIKRKT